MSRLSYLHCDLELNAANGQMGMKFDEIGFKLIFKRGQRFNPMQIQCDFILELWETYSGVVLCQEVKMQNG